MRLVFSAYTWKVSSGPSLSVHDEDDDPGPGEVGGQSREM